MLNGIASKIISHLCGQYIDKINSSQLEIEIWNGKAHLENVTILENSFLARQIPFKVKNGIIGSLTLTFPWTKLSTNPCIIDIDNILLVGEVCGGGMEESENIPNIENTDSGIEEKSIFDSIITKVLNNLIINIQNIHIRVEALTNNTNNNMAIGLKIPSINVYTIDERGEKTILNEHPKVLNKKVEIRGFAIYVDTHCTFINNESFVSQMIDENSSAQHQFIFNPFSFDAIYNYNSSSDLSYQTAFSVNSNDIEITLDNDQYKGIQVLLEQYYLFCKQRVYRHCGRPARPPRSDRSSTLWWHYSHRCALFRIEKKTVFEVGTAIEMLHNRSRYFELYKGVLNNTISDQQITDFEEQLDSKTVTLLRNYSSSLYSITINDISQSLTEEEKQVVIAENRNMKKEKKGHSQFNVVLNTLQLSLKETKNGNKITSFILKNLQTQLTKIKFNHSASIRIDSFYIMNYLSQQYPKTLEVSKGINGSFAINYNEPYRISLNISPIFAVVDVEWISRIIIFFEKKRAYIEVKDESQTLHQIQSIIDSHKQLNLDLTINDSHIIVPYQEIEQEDQPAFHITFNSFTLKSTPSPKYDLNGINSLFDNYTLDVKQIEMDFCDRKMSNQFDIRANLDVAIVTSDEIESVKGIVDVSTLELYSTTFQALVLKELSLYLADTFLLNAQNEQTGNTPENKVSINFKSFSASLSYEEKPLFKLELLNAFRIDVSNKNRTTTLYLNKEDSGLKIWEYFTGTEDNKLLSTEQFELSIEATQNYQSVDISLGKANLYAKSEPLNFIFVFAKSPATFEWTFNYSSAPQIVNYLHKKCISNANSNNTTKLQIKVDHTIGHLILPNNCPTERELLTIYTNSVEINGLISSKNLEMKVKIFPPRITTTQLGPLWKNIISETEMMALPILFCLTHTSFFVSLDSLKVNISPSMLIQVLNFFKEILSLHISIIGNPEIVPYLAFDVNAKNTVVNFIHNLEFRSYYEVKIPTLTFKTITMPGINQLIIDKVVIRQHTITSIIAESTFFSITNLNFLIEMNLILQHDIREIFNSVLQEKGLDNWEHETLNFIQNEHNSILLAHTYFFIHGIFIQMSFDDLLCTYSHNIARDMSFLIANLNKLIHSDHFDNNGANKPINPDLIKLALKLNTNSINIIILNPNQVASLRLDQLSGEVNTKDNLLSMHFDNLYAIDNQDERLLDARSFSVSSNKNEIKGTLDSLDLIIKLVYLPITIEYIMNCPFFSFLDEFENHHIQSTSFGVHKLIQVDVGKISINYPIPPSVFTLSWSFNALLSENQHSAEIREVQMILNKRSILNPFSIHFSDGMWTVEPIFATFSVFEFSIINHLLTAIKDLKMPTIYIKKKDVELAQRNFTITTSTIKFILTQPNLPFLILEIKPSIFKQTFDKNKSVRIIDYQIQPLVKHANYSNCGFDTIIDPFIITLKTVAKKSKITSDLKISPINIALSTQFLKEILIFRKKVKLMKTITSESTLFQSEHIFIKNDIGLPIFLVMSAPEKKSNENNPDRILLDSFESYQLTEFFLTHGITIEYLDTVIHFSINDLFFPLFFNGNSVAYLVADIGVQTIHFSSPFIIKNNLSYDIELRIGKTSMGAIKSESETPVPINLLPLLSQGIQCAMCPVKTGFSEPLVIKNYNSTSTLITIINNKSCLDTFLSVRSFVDPKHSICYIAYSSYLSFVNHLPMNITVIFEEHDFMEIEKELNIETGKSVDASFINQSRHSFVLKVAVDGFGQSTMTQIHPFEKQASPTMISIFDNNNEKCKIAIQTIYSNTDRSIQLVIFTPCVMFNKTGLCLHAKESRETNITNPFVNDIYLYTPLKFFKKKKVFGQLVYSALTFSNKEPFDCMHSGAIQTISLPYKRNTDVFLLLSVVTKDAPLQFFKTTVVTIGPSLCVMNHFNVPVYFHPSIPSLNDTNDFVNICVPNKLTSIIYSGENIQFDVYVEGYEKCQKVELVAQTTTVFRLLSQYESRPDFFIQLDVIKQKHGLCGHISYPTLPTPFVITNLLNNKIISAYQSNSPNHAVIIKSNTTALFAMDQPFITDSTKPTINLSINNGEAIFPVSYSSDTIPDKIQHTSYFYQVKTTKRGNQMIIVSENWNDFKIANKGRKQSTISFSLAAMQISFIDGLMHELFLLTIRSLKYQIDVHNSIQLTIDSIQLDDTFVGAKMPVVLCITHPKFVTASMKSNLPLKARSFDRIDASFAQIYIFLDLVFVNDVFQAIMELYREALINTEYHPEEMLGSKHAMKGKFNSFASYSISKFCIQPINIELNFRGTSGRLNIYPLSDALKISQLRLVPNISAANIQIPEMKIKHLRAPLAIIRSTFTEFYKDQILKVSLKLFFHIDLFLNTPEIVKSIVVAIKDDDKTTSEKLINLGSQLLQGSENAIRNVSSAINFFHLDKKSRLMNKCSQLLDKATHKISTVKQGLTDETIPPIQRISRAFPMGRIISFTISSSEERSEGSKVLNDGFGDAMRFATAQHTLYQFHPNDPNYIFERLIALIDPNAIRKDAYEKKALAVFDHYIVVLNPGLEFILFETKITNIVTIEQIRDNIIITSYDNSMRLEPFTFVCLNAKEACSIKMIISSIIERMRLYAE